MTIEDAGRPRRRSVPAGTEPFGRGVAVLPRRRVRTGRSPDRDRSAGSGPFRHLRRPTGLNGGVGYSCDGLSVPRTWLPSRVRVTPPPRAARRTGHEVRHGAGLEERRPRLRAARRGVRPGDWRAHRLPGRAAVPGGDRARGRRPDDPRSRDGGRGRPGGHRSRRGTAGHRPVGTGQARQPARHGRGHAGGARRDRPLRPRRPCQLVGGPGESSHAFESRAAAQAELSTVKHLGPQACVSVAESGLASAEVWRAVSNSDYRPV